MTVQDLFFSTDVALIDREWVRKQIKLAYWGGWRTDEIINISMAHSRCMGLYYPDPETGGEHGRIKYIQVAFARVVTDGSTFSWLADVIVDPEHRGKGYGKFLVSQIMELDYVKRTVCLLGTRDAHNLYERFGFNRHEVMRKIPSNA